MPESCPVYPCVREQKFVIKLSQFALLLVSGYHRRWGEPVLYSRRMDQDLLNSLGNAADCCVVCVAKTQRLEKSSSSRPKTKHCSEKNLGRLGGKRLNCCEGIEAEDSSSNLPKTAEGRVGADFPRKMLDVRIANRSGYSLGLRVQYSARSVTMLHHKSELSGLWGRSPGLPRV